MRPARIPRLKKCARKFRRALLDMLTIPGLRADKVIKLYQELGITSLAELEEAAREGQPAKG